VIAIDSREVTLCGTLSLSLLPNLKRSERNNKNKRRNLTCPNSLLPQLNNSPASFTATWMDSDDEEEDGK
jgi:hypothetical protein